MRFLSTAALLVLSAISSATAASFLERRQTVVSAHGTTVAPADGSVIAPGSSFPFNYTDSDQCFNGYSPISVYLSESPPVAADITTSGGLANGSFVFHLGDYLIANFGLPEMSNPPPSTLTMPALDTVNGSTTLYLSVVETFLGCPPNGQVWYGFETTTVVYG